MLWMCMLPWPSGRGGRRLLWFVSILFGLDLCVVDVYVTLAFGSRRKNGPNCGVMD
jgi:hypothetical protein